MAISKILDVNGKAVTTSFDDPECRCYMLLRDDLGLHGPRFGCGLAQCGACTVHVDGQAARSCVSRFLDHAKTTKSSRWKGWARRKIRIRCSARSSKSRRCNAVTASTA